MRKSPLILLLILQVFAIACSPKTPLHSSWHKKDYCKANTARYAFYLSRKSKESIRIVNMARMNGPLFARTYYIDFLIENEKIKSKEDTLSLQKLPYYGSLYQDLSRQGRLHLLKPSFALNLSSGFHATTSGLSGYTGHDRPLRCEARIKLFGTFCGTTGENCDYGNRQAFDAVMSLLVDESISSLGHRRNILNKNYKRIGCSFKPHKKYNCNYVQDFSAGRFIERKRK